MILRYGNFTSLWTTISLTFSLLARMYYCPTFKNSIMSIGFEKFDLKIMNVSTNDEGMYTCKSNRIWIKPARK